MPISAPTSVVPPAAHPPAGRRMSIEEYHRMVESDVLTEADPVELLEGRLVPKMPRRPPHDSVVDQLQEILLKLAPAGWRARVQSAITLSDSEPEPDLAVVPGPASRYHESHPIASDIALVVEVADTSLRQDRVLKNLIYSRASIPVYWIVNLIDRQIEMYTQPSGPIEEPRYAERHDYRSGESAPIVLDGKVIGSIAVDDLLP